MAEKGWSRTIRATYAPQLGFEDRWGHRAPSFSPTGGAKIPRLPRRGKVRPWASSLTPPPSWERARAYPGRDSGDEGEYTAAFIFQYEVEP